MICNLRLFTIYLYSYWLLYQVPFKCITYLKNEYFLKISLKCCPGRGGPIYNADIHLKPTKVVHQQLVGSLFLPSVFQGRSRQFPTLENLWCDFQSQFYFYQRPISYIYIFKYMNFTAYNLTLDKMAPLALFHQLRAEKRNHQRGPPAFLLLC